MIVLTGSSFVSATDVIKTQPVSQTICKGSTAEFFVEVKDEYQSGYQVSYRWYKDGIAIKSNATNSTYTATLAGEYSCLVNVIGVGSEASNGATLTVLDKPTVPGIDVSPACNGGLLVAKPNGAIIDNGSPITGYVWRLGGVVVGNNPELDIQVAYSQNNSQLEFSVENGCGTSIALTTIEVYDTPNAPTVTSKTEYCREEQAAPLAIVQNNALWYTQATGGYPLPEAPTPNTGTVGTQTWWVSFVEDFGGDVLCESSRAEVKITVIELSDLPVTDTQPTYCINASNPILTATGDPGDIIQWYNQQGNKISAPVINTSTVGTQTFYVTRTQPGKCESPKQEVIVTIQDRASQQLINIPDIPHVCSFNNTTITLSAEIPDPIFRWYTNSNKTGLFNTGPTYETPVLTANTVYYVTLQYEGFCESNYPRTIIVNVGDNIRPQIIAPGNLEIKTNDGVCYATNVDLGLPEVSDNCTPTDQLRIYIEPAAPNEYQLGSTTLTWWVEDLVGNKEKAQQTVTVIDAELPKGTCPDDIEIIVNTDIFSAKVDYTLDYTDNCGVVSVDLLEGLPSGSLFPLGETTVRHSITDKAGNVVECVFKVLVRHPYRELEVSLRVYPYEICSGQSVVITPVVSGGSGLYTYSWTPRTWTNAVMEDYPLVSTTYEVTVSDGFTSKSKSVDISVLETEPVALVYDGRVDEILEGDEITVKATPGFASYKFLLNNKVVQEIGSNNQIAFQAELGTYAVRVFATDVNYCVAQDQLEIPVESKRLPNVFTPNQDGKNEIFLEGYDLTVFSRAGELLYKGTSGWDGTYKGKIVPQGTYLYVVKRTMNNGEHRVYKGTVTLKL